MCKKFGMHLPLIHSVVLNRSTQYNKSASKAFAAMFDEIKRTVEVFFEKNRECFVSGGPKFIDMPDNLGYLEIFYCGEVSSPLCLQRYSGKS